MATGFYLLMSHRPCLPKLPVASRARRLLPGGFEKPARTGGVSDNAVRQLLSEKVDVFCRDRSDETQARSALLERNSSNWICSSSSSWSVQCSRSISLLRASLLDLIISSSFR